MTPLYSCTNDHCATEHSWPADDLCWWPGDGLYDAGWYCEYCWDELPEDEKETLSAAGFRTISLWDHLADLDDAALREHILRPYGK